MMQEEYKEIMAADSSIASGQGESKNTADNKKGGQGLLLCAAACRIIIVVARAIVIFVENPWLQFNCQNQRIALNADTVNACRVCRYHRLLFLLFHCASVAVILFKVIS